MGILIALMVSCTNGGSEATQPQSASAVISDLQSGNNETILHALQNCDAFVTEPDVVNAIADLLGNPDPDISEAVRSRLIEVGDAATPRLIDALADPQMMIDALQVLTNGTVPHPDAVPRIMELLEGDSTEVNVWALRYFSKWGDGGHDLKGLIDQFLIDPTSTSEVLNLALDITTTERYALGTTIASYAILYPDKATRTHAFKALTFLAPLEPEAENSIEQMLPLPDLTQDEKVWLNGSLYIGDSARRSRLDNILEALTSEDIVTVEAAIDVLGMCPQLPSDVSRSLQEALANPNIPQRLTDKLSALISQANFTDEVSPIDNDLTNPSPFTGR